MSTAISAADLHTLLSRGNCCLVDVREPVEHAEEHIATGRLIPLGRLERSAAELPQDKPVVFMCRSGTRGRQALARMEALGFTNARNLEGGIVAWKAAGLPVARSGKMGLPLMQQVQIVIGTGVLAGVVLSVVAHPGWIFLSAFFGAGLIFAGSTGWCGMAILMSKMPWNRVAARTSCAPGVSTHDASSSDEPACPDSAAN